ncbi:phospholipase D-like domain-containing protein [Natrarchaeobaculum sulfurireducens]|uniref:Phospholipase D n=1 Tax=Natrarchaeobaculum sulfurireducens TaxID=2044521 RepID=A0A346PNQ3_9EURY|nr:phospholipase D-like domain-containing protein [Natrarchaeobaculum sulfurireducens]AXR81148.1 phospholipase D [Natrarchaeobaculum sulfurireducens]
MSSPRARVAIMLVLCALTIAGTAPAVAAAGDGTAGIESESSPVDCHADRTASADLEEPRIVELYPNPTIDDNVGEYLVVETPPETTLENLTVTDGHTTAQFPDERVSGRVAASTDATVTETLTDDPVIELEGGIRLAVDGDDLELRDGDEPVDAVSYERAPLAERWHRIDPDGASETEDAASALDDVAGAERDGQGKWHPRDATCLPVSSTAVDEATTFVLPDSPEMPRETLQAADERILLAGYTISSDAVARDLVDAADRGVDVAVLVESGPVGGTPAASEPVLEMLDAGGVDVRAIGGEGARYRYHHPKYAVADDRVLVTSENWNPSGVGGESSRGWGVRVVDADLAADLEAVFWADFEGRDTEPGAAFRANATFVEGDDAADDRTRTFPTDHDATAVNADAVDLLLAPDNAEAATLELLGGADDEILIKQASIAADATVLEETVAAARRGVDVRILLDSTWYHEDENAALQDDLERTAATEGLPLEVELVDETDRFEKIHAKGVVVDREVAIVGSANWNQNAFENNREVLLAVHGTEAGEYYADVFEADWEDDPWSLPFGLSVTVVVALLFAAVVGYRYVSFGTERAVGRGRSAE